MDKKGFLVLFILLSIIISFGFISANDLNDSKKVDDLVCLPCGDECLPDDFVTSAYCNSPTVGNPICGVENRECVVLGFNDKEFVTDWDGTCGDFDCDELELSDGGLTPDKVFYFLDEFFDRFRSDLENREEKIAELKMMVEAGKFEEAQEVIIKYNRYAEKLEKEVNPNDLQAAKRSSLTIEKTLRELEDQIPEAYRKNFVNDVIEQEENIRTAVEISSKIKELCVELAELDPVQYFKVCRSEDDDPPEWKKELDKDLTKEQRKEAKEFGEIMSECFETSGRDCRCEDISFYDFSIACSKIAPLAVECDAGSEDACMMMDEIEMPELPDFLEEIFEDIEDKYSEDKYEMHMPKECIELEVTNPKDCGKIMIKEHAPLECRQALLDADVQNEREGREICDKIMFEKYSPIECIEKGITDPRECENFMDNFRGEFREGLEGGFDPFDSVDCMSIENAKERLKCFEGAVGDMGNYYGVGERFDNNQGEITWQCKENRIHWGPDCENFMREEWPGQERQKEDERNRFREDERKWQSEWGQKNNYDQRYEGDEGFYPGDEYFPEGDEGFYPGDEGGYNEPPLQQEEQPAATEYAFEPEPAPITGEVVGGNSNWNWFSSFFSKFFN